MTKHKDDAKALGRRSVLGGIGGLGALALLVACGDDEATGTTSTDGGTGGSDGGTTGSDGGTTGSDSGGGTIDANGFAVGSGAYLADKTYESPFTTAAGACTLYVAATEGPCHSNTYNRKDISDGLVGLPTRFDLRVVDASCNPVAGAIVEIWYASPAGTYSKAAETLNDASGYAGSLSDLNVGFCTGNNAEALAAKWLRGFQTTGADGRAQFDGIFPGWYKGRTPHVHFIVSVNGKKFISQFVFNDALTTTIYTQHGSYKAYGDKDTTTTTDNVVGKGGLTVEMATVNAKQQADGALLVWHSVAVS